MKRSEFKRKSPMKQRAPKPHKCKVCGESFVPTRQIQPTCGKMACMIAHGIKVAEKSSSDRAKQYRKEQAAIKKESTPLKERKKLAERATNRYVRARDYFNGCFTCDKGPNWDGVWHASHYKSVGSNSRLRYNLWNIHKACSECNHFEGGNIGAYRAHLEHKYGLDRVEWLNCQNGVTEYTAEYLDRLTLVMNKKALRTEKRNKRMLSRF